MAELKAGTTIGGSLVWTQGNFPLNPAGNQVLYKTYKIYTEFNKPQATDNDFVSKAFGGDYVSTVGFRKGLMVIGQSGVSPNGVSLYGPYTGGVPVHGTFFGTQDDHGSYGSAGSTWGTYFVTDSAGGWIYKWKGTPVASISTSSIFTSNRAVSLLTPSLPEHLTRKDYVDGLISTTTGNANSRVLRAGDTMTGTLTAPNFTSSNLATLDTQVPQLKQVVQRGVIIDYGTF